jgi:tripartite-type tricarboxylate transporter receptor subunit TctC
MGMCNGLMQRLAAWVMAVALAMIIACGQSEAQDAAYPNRPVRVVVGFAAGAFNDIMVRSIAPKLGERLGQPVVVDNKPGAGGNIAAEHVARAAPDGYTLLAAPTSSLAINPFIYSKLPYDPRRDFTPVSHIADFALFMAVAGELPINSAADLVAWGKANPAKANWGSVAPSFDLLMAVFNKNNAVAFERIPFKSTAESMSALLTGQVAVAFQDNNSMRAHLATGKVRPLVTLSSKRSPDLPDVPTGAETGQPDLVFDSLTGIVAPRATPAAFVRRLASEIQAVMKDPEIRARWKSLGMVPVGSTAEAFAATLDAERNRWEKIQKATGIKLD